jgi:hypothetical protein
MLQLKCYGTTSTDEEPVYNTIRQLPATNAQYQWGHVKYGLGSPNRPSSGNLVEVKGEAQ